MGNLRKYLILLLMVFIGSGCASTGKKLTALDESVQRQQKNLRESIEQIDRNASLIRNNKNELAEIQQKLAGIESRVSVKPIGESPEVQELKDNVAFLNDQILRLDSSIRTAAKRPVLPTAASAFKPGGFDVKTSYAAARKEYESRHYESAISAFMEVLTVAPTSSLADNAQYWIGECHYALKNYEKAIDAFNKVFNFPESNKLPDAHYKIGKTYSRMGKTDAAKEELKAVVQNYPGTNAAKNAAKELGKLGE